MSKQELIDRVNSNPALLNEFKTGWQVNSIEEYLTAYSYIPDIVERLADDLGVK